MTIPARRRPGGAPIVLIVCGVLALVPAAAAGKPRRADLTVAAVTLSAAPAAGATVKARVTVRNTQKVSAPRSQLSVSLETLRAKLARAAVGKLKPGGKLTLSVAVKFPRSLALGRYRITVCADAAKKVRERSETNNCRKLSQVLEVVAPAVLPAPRLPAPAPVATPAETATVTPAPTASPAPAGEVPPDQLPPLIPSIADTAEQLYAGQGVVTGAIAEARAGILRGRTIQRNGQPQSGVRVRVHDHPELGSTTTAADGTFELAVNGGAQITLEYTRAGQLEVQRDIDPNQLDWTSPPDVVMLDADQAGVVLDPPGAGSWTNARATSQTDADGTRTSTLLFAPGTTATMRFADGTTRPLPAPWTVRQTEYTSVGPAAMPGDLPATSGYTYAVELAIDEAAGADSVELTAASPAAPAAVNYVDNFVGIAVGADVPTGAYDRTDTTWEPAPDGRVVKVISESGGMAQLDTDGDGDSDAADYPAALKLTDDERKALVPLFEPGDELFRVPIPHMTPWDHNFPYGLPPGALRPRIGPDGRLITDGCRQSGSSTIGCEDQKLSESVHVAGTPYRLSYSSAWEPGAGGSRKFDVAVTPPALPSGLVAVELVVEIAGQTITRRYVDPARFPPGSGLDAIAPDIVEHVAWDGLDGFGEPVIGSVLARITLDYYYEVVYYPGGDESLAEFAQIPGGLDSFFVGANRVGCSATALLAIASGDLCAFKTTAKETRSVGSVGRTEVGLGAWDLDAHHVYDALAGAVHLGDGTVRRGGEVDIGRLRTVAGPGAAGSTGDPIGTDILGALPDGSILHGGTNVINRTPPGQAAVRFAGNESQVSTRACDGGPALQRSLYAMTSIAVRPNGGVVVAIANAPSSEWGNRICEITPDGRLVLIGGNDIATCPSGNDCRGDGGLAKNAPIQRPDHLTIARDGSVYFVEDPGPTNGQRKYIRRIDPTGIISTVAGGGNGASLNPEAVPASGYTIGDVRSLLAMDDGSVLMADNEAGIVIELGTDGLMRRYAGGFHQSGAYALDVDRRLARIGRPFAVVAGRDGSVYVLVESDNFPAEIRRRVVRIRPDGVVVRALGFGAQTPCPPAPTELESAVDRCGLGAGERLAVDGDGRVLLFDGTPARIRRIEPTLEPLGPGGKAIPSADGSEVWFFDASGRHLRTVDGLTGSLVREFGYDAAGRLVRAEDADGGKTLIERNGAGAPTAIVAPDGRRTALSVNAAGKLSAIADPTGATRGLSYDGGGRLSGQQLPSGRTSSYAYDGDGRLISATGAAGQTRQLARSEIAGGTAVEVTTGAGRVTRYTVSQTAGGGMRRTVRTPSGSLTTLLVDPDGTRTLTLPSGETRRTATTSDKRFGAAVSLVRSRTTTAPSGKSVTVNYAYSATLASAGNLFGPTQVRTDMTGPLGLTRMTYTGATRTVQTTTPAGRQVTTTLDARGRKVAEQVGDPGALAPTTVEYGAQGQVSRIAQGSHVTRYERDVAGRLTAIVAADGQRLEYAYDAADRLTERRYPDGRTYRYGRDPDGELISRRLPSAREHTFVPTGLPGAVSAWTPPGASGSYSVALDDDELATSITTPSGATRPLAADAAGRPTGVAGRTATYVPGVDRIATYESTAAPAAATQSLTPGFDGMRVTKLTAAGLAPAETTWTYDANLRQASTRLVVSGAVDATLAYTRDADGALTGVGPFTYVRSGPDKSVSAITDGTGRTDETVDSVADLKTRQLTVGGSEKYRLELTTDATGRIVARREVAGASDHTYAYAYDAIGELTEVRRDGVPVEAYAYDVDGDRRSQGASYDAGGKLTGRGATSYGFDADGFLATRGADTFTYARSGELRSATVGGTTIAYAYDGLGRMVARIDGGATTGFVYGDPDFAYRVSAARAPDGTVDRYLYGPRGNLYAILRGGVRFHVATDQVGSPRVVVDAGGTVVKRLEYDAYGVTTDLDPQFFLPFGYGGGLRDPVTGLVRFGLRDYEPQSGRFTARDPAGFAGSPRSLYGYASNSPVTYHDPGGTASVSFGGYFGPGGGTTIYFDPGAFFNLDKPLITGLCAEFGVGLGGGLEEDFLEEAPTEGSLSAFAEASGKALFLGGKAGGEFDLICGKGKIKYGGNLGPLQVGRDSEGTPSLGEGIDTSADRAQEALSLTGDFKLEGKAGFKVCLPPPPT